MTDIVLTAIAPILWGTTYVIATEFLRDWDPFLVAALRALPAGIILTIIGGVRPRRIWWWRTLVLGTLNIGAFFALLFVAAYRIPGGVVATIGAIQPIIVLLLTWLFLAQKPRPASFILAVTGLVGVAFLVLGPRGQLDSVGITAAVGAAVSMATGVVLTKHWGRPASLIAFTGWQLTAGGLIVAVISLVSMDTLPSVNAINWLGIAWLGVLNTAVGYLLWFRGVGHLRQAWHLSILALLSPVVAVLAGWLVLGQALTPLQSTGAVLVLGSVIVGQRI